MKLTIPGAGLVLARFCVELSNIPGSILREEGTELDLKAFLAVSAMKATEYLTETTWNADGRVDPLRCMRVINRARRTLAKNETFQLYGDDRITYADSLLEHVGKFFHGAALGQPTTWW